MLPSAAMARVEEKEKSEHETEESVGVLEERGASCGVMVRGNSNASFHRDGEMPVRETEVLLRVVNVYGGAVAGESVRTRRDGSLGAHESVRTSKFVGGTGRMTRRVAELYGGKG